MSPRGNAAHRTSESSIHKPSSRSRRHDSLIMEISSARILLHEHKAVEFTHKGAMLMAKGFLLWLLGVPASIVVLLWLFGVLS
jgi:hypothetical protein